MCCGSSQSRPRERAPIRFQTCCCDLAWRNTGDTKYEDEKFFVQAEAARSDLGLWGLLYSTCASSFIAQPLPALARSPLRLDRSREKQALRLTDKSSIPLRAIQSVFIDNSKIDISKRVCGSWLQGSWRVATAEDLAHYLAPLCELDVNQQEIGACLEYPEGTVRLKSRAGCRLTYVAVDSR